MRNCTRIASAAPAANQDAPYHDLFSLLHKLGQVQQLAIEDWQRLTDLIEAEGRPLERMTVGELIALLDLALLAAGWRGKGGAA